MRPATKLDNFAQIPQNWTTSDLGDSPSTPDPTVVPVHCSTVSGAHPAVEENVELAEHGTALRTGHVVLDRVLQPQASVPAGQRPAWKQDQETNACVFCLSSARN